VVVREARDGQEALELLAEEGTVNLVLSDVMMPRLGGRELLSRLRVERPDLPMVCMSGYTDDRGLAKALRDGRGRFIQKPFSAATLLRVVREVLDLARQARPH
jgi:two-component system, cell cycle sensor histidine kinase and response regulator CckA